ncbi:MAG: hypothetical protein HQ509_08930 [Candidatus Marinimicrobia bacterium]|nr:hypothetical protein [Candidatus Neomarinimicrobiota bacterium]
MTKQSIIENGSPHCVRDDKLVATMITGQSDIQQASSPSWGNTRILLQRGFDFFPFLRERP